MQSADPSRAWWRGGDGDGKRGGKARHAHDREDDQASLLENCQEAAAEPKKENTRDRVGAALGMSGRTYEKAHAVIEAAEEEPKRFGDLVATMDDNTPTSSKP